MIKKLEQTYPNIIAFEFLGEIMRVDFNQNVNPEIESLIEEIEEINLVYLLNTNLKDFTMGNMVERCDAWYLKYNKVE
ncbi:MAG: hypothetical protein WCY77_11460 [Weeksellaceae bacterium]